MSFLAPWYVPVLVMAATVPPLVLLYFLKLKRREMPIASTLLWRRAVEDLQVNSPFQRLRNNLLLILQLLVLLLAALTIAEPFRAGVADVEKSLTLLIDQSGSMSVDEGHGKTRLDIAREEAMKTIDQLGPSQRAMVIAFADRAKVCSPFTNDKESLRRAVNAVAPTDEAGRLAEAMQLAEAYSTPIGEVTDVPQSYHILFTDGRLPDAEKVAVQRGRMEVVTIGQATENVGIVDLDVRRRYDKPEVVSVVARVRNFGGQKVTCDFSLLVDGEMKTVRTLRDLVPLTNSTQLGTLATPGMPPEGNETTVAFEMALDKAAEIEVRLSGQDAFSLDDRAFALVPAPRPITALLVTPGNRYLRDLMAAMPLVRHDIWSPQEYENNPEDKLVEAGRCKYDVVIMDAHSTERLPPGSYLFFGGIPAVQGVQAEGLVRQEVFLDWDETHPVLRHVAINAVNVFSWQKIKVPDRAKRLIESSSGPVMALLNQERHQFLLCAFGFFDENREMLNTDWVFNESLVVFFHNALRFLAGNAAQSRLASLRAGESFSMPVPPNVKTATIHRPDGRKDEVNVRSSGLLSYNQTDRTGFYRVSGGIADDSVRAVNLLNEDESFIAPCRNFRIASGQLVAGDGSQNLRKPLWPYLLMVLGVILLFEWIIYNKRVFI